MEEKFKKIKMCELKFAYHYIIPWVIALIFIIYNSVHLFYILPLHIHQKSLQSFFFVLYIILNIFWMVYVCVLQLLISLDKTSKLVNKKLNQISKYRIKSGVWIFFILNPRSRKSKKDLLDYLFLINN